MPVTDLVALVGALNEADELRAKHRQAETEVLAGFAVQLTDRITLGVSRVLAASMGARI